MTVGQAKPKCELGAETCALRKSPPPCLLAILRLTALLGSVTDTSTLTGDYAYANDVEVRLRALTHLAKD